MTVLPLHSSLRQLRNWILGRPTARRRTSKISAMIIVCTNVGVSNPATHLEASARCSVLREPNRIPSPQERLAFLQLVTTLSARLLFVYATGRGNKSFCLARYDPGGSRWNLKPFPPKCLQDFEIESTRLSLAIPRPLERSLVTPVRSPSLCTVHEQTR